MSSLRAELGAAQARVLELTAEGARLKQQLVRMGRVQARADEMASELAAAKSAAAAAEAQHEDRLSKVCAAEADGASSPAAAQAAEALPPV